MLEIGSWSLTFQSGAVRSDASGVFQTARVRSVIGSPTLIVAGSNVCGVRLFQERNCVAAS